MKRDAAGIVDLIVRFGAAALVLLAVAYYLLAGQYKQPLSVVALSLYVAAGFFLVCCSVSRSTRLSIAVASISSYSIMLLVNLYLIFTQHPVTYESLARQRGLPFDKRTKLEVVHDGRMAGRQVVPAVYGYLFMNDAKAPFIPLAGVSNALTIRCNERGEWVESLSDRHGFNNPDTVWDQSGTDVVLFGDSFTYGDCVTAGDDIAGQLRRRGISAVTLGIGGDGPLLNYATWLEYGRSLYPKAVVFVFHHNNLMAFHDELQSRLTSYLETRAATGLLKRQPEIDAFLNAYIDDELSKRLHEVRGAAAEQSKTELLLRIFTLKNIRDLIGLSSDASPLGALLGIDPRYARQDKMMKGLVAEAFKLMQELHFDVEGHGGRFYVVYLPAAENLREGRVDPYERLLLSRLGDTGVKVLNFESYLRAKRPDPLSIFPFGLGGHYLPEGYGLVADQIKEGIGEDLKTMSARYRP